MDDHELVREGIKRLINGYFTICGEASNGREALSRTIELKPDLVILDINMPILNGLDAAREIRVAAPGTKILLLSMHDSQQLELEAKAVGVDACASKSTTGTQLMKIIEQLVGSTNNRPELLVDG